MANDVTQKDLQALQNVVTKKVTEVENNLGKEVQAINKSLDGHERAFEGIWRDVTAANKSLDGHERAFEGIWRDIAELKQAVAALSKG
jgi:hypothetical protein